MMSQQIFLANVAEHWKSPTATSHRIGRVLNRSETKLAVSLITATSSPTSSGRGVEISQRRQRLLPDGFCTVLLDEIGLRCERSPGNVLGSEIFLKRAVQEDPQFLRPSLDQ